MSGTRDAVVEAYSAQAESLTAGYEAVSTEAMLAEALPYVVRDGAVGLALDVGSGTGRDAAWLVSRGYEVVAVEPAAGMRRVAETLHADRGIRWLDDALPALERTHSLALSFDLILLSAVWQHVRPADRARALRKLATLMKPGGILVVTLRAGPAPADRPMHPTSAAELEGLSRAIGLEVLRIGHAADLGERDGVTWTTMCMRMPDDGTGALPLVRGIVLADDKSSTYKLALLRSVARIAEYAPAAATPAPDGRDAVEVPMGLVALNWIRMYLPLVRARLPQAPGNVGTERLAFAKEGFEALLALSVAPGDLRIGAGFSGPVGDAVVSAISRTCQVVASMPANFTRYPNSDRKIFEVARGRRARTPADVLDLSALRTWGLLEVPGHLWRAMSRFGSWIEPMLVAEWARLTRAYGERMGVEVGAGTAEAALVWSEPLRTTALPRMAAARLLADGSSVSCVWTGRSLGLRNLDVDHCLPWSALPCGDLWNLMPCHDLTNRRDKRDRLPSAAAMASARDPIVEWWEAAYLGDPALRRRFLLEASAALPSADDATAPSIYAALDWRRMRLRQDQQVPEWTPARAA